MGNGACACDGRRALGNILPASRKRRPAASQRAHGQKIAPLNTGTASAPREERDSDAGDGGVRSPQRPAHPTCAVRPRQSHSLILADPDTHVARGYAGRSLFPARYARLPPSDDCPTAPTSNRRRCRCFRAATRTRIIRGVGRRRSTSQRPRRQTSSDAQLNSSGPSSAKDDLSHVCQRFAHAEQLRYALCLYSVSRRAEITTPRWAKPGRRRTHSHPRRFVLSRSHRAAGI